MPHEAEPVYLSFLVRCWFLAAGTANAQAVWRFELREVSTDGQKHTFGTYEQLMAFVANRLALA